jgi:anti-sigma-K factor RskA
MSEPGDEMSSDEMGSADMSGAAMDCAGLAEVAAEVALGVLTGRERAQAVAHLDRCDACREDVRQLMATSEGLLALLPESEPPAGFETRVLDRMGLSVAAGEGNARARRLWHARPRRAPRAPQTPRGPRGPRVWGARRLVASAAVVLAVIGAGVAGWGISTATAPHPGLPAAAQAPLNSASLLTPSDQNVGQVFLFKGAKDQGGPQWMYMSVDLPKGDGTVTCQVVGGDGKVTTVGSFRLTDGYGAWGSTGSWGGGMVRAARVLAPDGTVLATATFAQAYAR